MKAVIIGAGMGGLSAAIALKQIGHEVEVYEQVTENKPVGAAISVWSNGVKCLNHLGLEKQTAALGGIVDSMGQTWSDPVITKESSGLLASTNWMSKVSLAKRNQSWDRQKGSP